MQVGDLVKATYLHEDSPDRHLLGVIVARADGDRDTGNDAFKVLWTCGSISERMWDYDLKKVTCK